MSQSNGKNGKQLRQFTPEEKATILRRHLADKVPVSDLCDEYHIQPTLFYLWQRQAFEPLCAALQDGRTRRGQTQAASADRLRITALEARIAKKDEIIAEVSEEFLALKKSLGRAKRPMAASLLIPFQLSPFARPQRASCDAGIVPESGEPIIHNRRFRRAAVRRALRRKVPFNTGNRVRIAIVPHLKPSSFENASRTPRGASGRIAATMVAVRSDDRQMPLPRQARVP